MEGLWSLEGVLEGVESGRLEPCHGAEFAHLLQPLPVLGSSSFICLFYYSTTGPLGNSGDRGRGAARKEAPRCPSFPRSGAG